MLNHIPRDPGHIHYFPCENIKIFPEKTDEREFLFGVELWVNLELLLRISGIGQNFLVVPILCCPFFFLSNFRSTGG
jgi:hypothetical protein